MSRKLAMVVAPCLLLAGCLMSHYEIDPSLDGDNGGSGGKVSSNGGSAGRATAGTSTEGGEPETGGSSGAPNGGTQTSGGSVTAGGTKAMGGTTSTGGTSQAGGNAQGGKAGETSGGGVAGAGGMMNPGPSVCDNETKVFAMNEAYIDNFDTDARFGGWYSYSDTNPPNVMMTRQQPGSSSTAYGGHVAASGIKLVSQAGFGAGFGYNFINSPTFKCVDVSAFDGISFWLKDGAGMSGLDVQIGIPETVPTDQGGDCVMPSPQCYAHPTKSIMMGASWTHYVLKWSDFTSANVTWSNGRLLNISLVTRANSYDVSIDEVTFFKGTAPTGPVSP